MKNIIQRLQNFQMGTSQSSQPLANQLQNYKIILKNPENNMTHLCHNETDKEYLLREHTYNQQPIYTKYMNEHKLRQSIKDDHLTHLIRVQGKQIDHLCSNLYKIYAIWEYPCRFLSDQINERMYQNRKFQDKQVWSILASAILGLSTLQKNKIKHEMLTTKNLLLDSDGIMKIADPLACGSTTNLDSVFRNRDLEGVYISPQQCQALQSRGSYSNPYKSDVWIMGLIALECGLLESMKKCYKDQFQRIDYNLINTKLQQFGRQYGQQLRMILQLMLRKDNKDRPDWVDLQQYARKSNPSNTVIYSNNNNNQQQQSPYTSSPSSFTGYSQTLTKPDQVKKVVNEPRPEIKSDFILSNQNSSNFSNMGNVGWRPNISNNPNINNYSYNNNYVNGNVPLPSSNPTTPISVNKPTITHNLGYHQTDITTQINNKNSYISNNIGNNISNIPTYAPTNNPLPTFTNAPFTNNVNYSTLPSINTSTNTYINNNINTFRPNPPTPINTTNIQTYTSNFGSGGPANSSKPPVSFSTNTNTINNSNTNINTSFQSFINPTTGFQPLMRPTQYNTFQSTLSNRGNLFPNPNTIKAESNPKASTNDNTISIHNKYQSWKNSSDTNTNDIKTTSIPKNKTDSTNLAEKPVQKSYYNYTNFNSFPSSKYSHITSSYTATSTPTGLPNFTSSSSGLGQLNNDYSGKSASLFTSPELLSLISKNNKIDQKGNKYVSESIATPNFIKLGTQKSNQYMNDKLGTAPYQTKQPQNNIQSITQHINTVQSNSKFSYSPQNSNHQKQASIQPQNNKKQINSAAANTRNVNDQIEQSPQKPEYVIETFKQGSRYEGYKLRDMRHGQGKFYYQDGGMYDGNWVNNMMDGFGSLYYQSGEIAYQGMWRQDQFQGKGRLYNQSPYQLQQCFNYQNFDEIQQFWAYYQGQFVEDFKKGKGILMLSNGEYFQGTFNNDMVEGPGVFHCKDGKIIQGVWQHNHLVG